MELGSGLKVPWNFDLVRARSESEGVVLSELVGILLRPFSDRGLATVLRDKLVDWFMKRMRVEETNSHKLELNLVENEIFF